MKLNKFSGDYSGEATPVPIPNTEVKLLSADGTWVFPGRVGRRQIFLSILPCLGLLGARVGLFWLGSGYFFGAGY